MEGLQEWLNLNTATNHGIGWVCWQVMMTTKYISFCFYFILSKHPPYVVTVAVFKSNHSCVVPSHVWNGWRHLWSKCCTLNLLLSLQHELVNKSQKQLHIYPCNEGCNFSLDFSSLSSWKWTGANSSLLFSNIALLETYNIINSFLASLSCILSTNAIHRSKQFVQCCSASKKQLTIFWMHTKQDIRNIMAARLACSQL